MASIKVFFATNRNMTRPKSPRFGNTFHKDGAECYRVGSATVQSKDGEYKLKSFKVAPEKPSDTAGDEGALLGSSAVFTEIKRQMRDEGRDLVVLIHGYASNFASAPERGAELAEKYLVRGKDGQDKAPVVIVFSWPANGRTIPFSSYISDRDDAAKSGRAIGRLFLRLCDFLVGEARDMRRAKTKTHQAAFAPCPQRIHLVAHSMGNWALRNALQAIIDIRGADRLPAIFDNIFLMAADEDDDTLQDVAKMALLPRLGNTVHVYHSKDDQALMISDATKLNPDRLGSNGPNDITAVDEKVVAIDCRHVDDTELLHANHQYYRIREEVIADVRQVLAGVAPDLVQDRVRLRKDSRYMIQKPATA